MWQLFRFQFSMLLRQKYFFALYGIVENVKKSSTLSTLLSIKITLEKWNNFDIKKLKENRK